MKVKILMSGPIRPSIENVIQNIQSLREQLEDCEVYLLTWKGNNLENIKPHVDYLFEISEPSDEFIKKHVTGRTKQQRELNGQIESWTSSIYKMTHGVRMLCELSNCKDDDIVIRIRTDSIFSFHPNVLKNLINTVGNTYTVRNRKSSGCGLDDWFAITKFKNLRDVWTILDYNKEVQSSWNAEDLIFSRVKHYNIPIRYFDTSIVDCYIIRDNNFKHYFD